MSDMKESLIEPDIDPEERRKAAQNASAAERKRAIGAVFGSGVGKLAIIAAALVALLLIAVGARALRGDEEPVNANNAQFDSVNPNVSRDGNEAITPEEAERRDIAAQREANEAIEAGQTYQTELIPIIDDIENPTNESGAIGFGIDEPPPSPALAKVAAPSVPSNASAGGDADAASRQAQADRIAQELKVETGERAKYIQSIRDQSLSSIESLLGANGQGGGIGALGSYTQTRYPSAQETTPQVAETTAENQAERVAASNESIIFKAGSSIFVTLDNAVNTDDSDIVMGTVQSGEWRGSKVLGRVETGTNNIRLKFDTLAPQDDRPTFAIDAVALREQDARVGAADTIEHHTLERYSALGFAALLSGYGEAYQETPGTTIINPNGTTVQTIDEPSPRQINSRVAGEVGKAFAGEIGRGFARPTTYKTEAGRGFALYFLTDIKAGDQ